MNIGDIISQVVRMKGLMPEVNRTTVAYRFQTMITETMKKMFGDDDDRTLNWINNDQTEFIKACQLVAPRAPVGTDVVATSSALSQFIDKWEAVDTWRTDENDEWRPMSQETINVKATMLRDIRKVIQRGSEQATAPTPESDIQQG